MAENGFGDLVRGNLDLWVLSALADGPKYGYLIQQRLALATGGAVEVQAGTLYPLLHRLEAERLVRCRWEQETGRRRKWYDLTPAGRRRLEQQARKWQAYAAALRRILDPVLEGGLGAWEGAT
ncbi:MAG: PadR family transcriptional regulator [Planctomycetota bacterium]